MEFALDLQARTGRIRLQYTPHTARCREPLRGRQPPAALDPDRRQQAIDRGESQLREARCALRGTGLIRPQSAPVAIRFEFQPRVATHGYRLADVPAWSPLPPRRTP